MLSKLQSCLNDENYQSRHKSKAESFSRERKLSFRTVAILMLRRSIKSLQLVLNEFGEKFDKERVSVSAYSQARKKFCHTAFIELLDVSILKVFYRDGDHQTYRGHRLLAIDGSKVRLPNSKEIREDFGTVKSRNGERLNYHNEAKISVLYDLRNNLPLESRITRARTSELKLAEEHLNKLESGDIVIADRGYISYALMAAILNKNGHFIIRCSRKRFGDGAGLFVDSSVVSKTIELIRPKTLVDDNTIPASIRVRFIRVELNTGEVEVLITSLVDEQKYPSADFKSLYNERWGIETFYYRIKSRLCVENFTGKSAESILQDFHSTIYVCALETILTSEADEILKQKATKHSQKVNKAISFHVIKDKVFGLAMNDKPISPQQAEDLTSLFLQNPTVVRPLRINKRISKKRKGHRWASLHFYRNLKKHIF